MKDISEQINNTWDKVAETIHIKLGEKFYNKLSDQIWDGVAENLNAQIGTTSWQVIMVLRNQVK